MTMEQLYQYACDGDIGELSLYFTCVGERNQRYCDEQGKKHSLIMGAFENKRLACVRYLRNAGETLTGEEKEKLRFELVKEQLMRELLL